MIINSPKNIALINALIITIIAGIAFAIITVLYNQANVISIAIFLAVIFISSYAFINYSLNRFFNEKIKVIYKTIGKLRSLPEESTNTKTKSDVLDIVNQVVLTWSEEKKKEIEELKEMAAYRREFLGNISHEIKTPIFNIQGYVHTLLEGGLKDDTINKKFLKKSVKSINRMIALVEDLEEISKLETGDLHLVEENFNLPELTKEVIDFMEHKASENNTTIVINATSQRSIRVKADKKRIHQVQDNGIGIPEENIKRIFERFYRTDESRSRDKGGTGLGLAIVKHIIEAHRQTISVRSSVGEGTTFSFTLKMA